jgi:trimeric autotransporter adhesin
MSQAGIVDIEGSHPQIPTLFIANSGEAIPIANTLEILGNIVAAYGVPLQTIGSGNTITVVTQYGSAHAASSGTNAGLVSFNSTYFSVDANGFVTVNGTGLGETVTGNSGGALSPVAGNWNIFGSYVAAGTSPVTTSGTGNTLTVDVQTAQAIASTNVTNIGLAAFNSTYFTVDSNGFVSIKGTAIGETITGTTGGALSPTAGNWNILGSSTAAGTVPVQTAGSGSTLTIEVQKSQAIASTNAINVGLAAFNSSQFSVDANGFVSLTGTGSGETLTGNTGGALSPTAGNWNIFGSTVAAGSTPLATAGSGSTITINAQISQAIASTDATKIGLAAFSNADFSVDANGFVKLAGTGGAPIQTITGNSGGAETPSSGNFNILGTGSITVAGSTNTETVQLTGLTNHAIQVGAGTATLTQVGPSATAGQVLQSQGSTTDPAYSTATYPSTTTANDILYSSATNVVGQITTANSATLVTNSSGTPLFTSSMTNGQVVIGSTGATPTAATLSAGTGISITNGAGSITIASTGSSMTWTDEATSFNAVAGNGYFVTGAATATLPASPSQGNQISFCVDGSVALTITANTGQKIQIGTAISASAGTAVNSGSTTGASITLVFRSSDSIWFSIGAPQNAWLVT